MKKLPGWLIGGIIAVILFILAWTIIVVPIGLQENYGILYLMMPVSYLFSFVAFILQPLLPGTNESIELFAILLSSYFIFGFIIGGLDNIWRLINKRYNDVSVFWLVSVGLIFAMTISFSVYALYRSEKNSELIQQRTSLYNNPPADCSTINDPNDVNVKYHCYAEQGYTTGNIQLCSNIPLNVFSNSYAARCLTGACKTMAKGDGRDKCYYDVAVKTKFGTTCYDIENNELKKQCWAEANKDPFR